MGRTSSGKGSSGEAGHVMARPEATLDQVTESCCGCR
jgi:hypothetical protein